MGIECRLLTVFCSALAIVNCSSTLETVVEPSLYLERESLDAALLGKWTRSCALCHVNGEAGAPIVGDTESWAERLTKGEEALIESVIQGINSMPPLGYCMSCETDDFRSMIRFMSNTST